MTKEQRQPSAADLILGRREQKERQERESAELETIKFQTEARRQWEGKVVEARRKAEEIQRRNKYFEDLDKKYRILDSLREINERILQRKGTITASLPYGTPHVYDEWEEAYKTSWEPFSVSDAEFSLETPVEKAQMTIELNWNIENEDTPQLPSWGPRIESDFLTDEVITRRSGNTVRVILEKDKITILGGCATAFSNPYQPPMIQGAGSGQQGYIGPFYPDQDLSYLPKILTAAFENSHWILQSLPYNRRKGKPSWY